MMPIEAAEDLIGSVKKVESKTFSLFGENGDSVEHFESESNCSFDEANNLIEIVHRHADKNWQKTINKFDSKNRLIEQLSFENETLKSKTGFNYNDRDQMVESKFFNYRNNPQSDYRPVYTKEGLRIDEILHEPFLREGENVLSQRSFLIAPEIRVSFSLNDVLRENQISGGEGQILEITFFNRLRLPAGKISVIYGTGDKPVKINKYGGNSGFYPRGSNYFYKLFFRSLNKLSDFLMTLYVSAKLVARKNYQQALNCLIFGAPIDETFIEYNDQGRVCEISVRSVFTGAGAKTFFDYDEHANKTQMNAFSADETLYHSEKHEYQYDSQNNWTTRETFYRLANNGSGFLERTILTRRKIEYF